MSSAVDKKKAELREFYENNLWEFAKYINPHYCYADIHRKVFEWLSDPECSRHQLLLLPRGHLKSHCIAVWAVWQITRQPWTTMVYLSAGEDLANQQVYAIKNMMLSDRYQLLWPDMINQKDNDRDKWSAWAINVDHPSRKERGVRDHTLVVKTVKSNAIGLHCSHLILDDVVIPRFAYTSTGRREVQQSVSQFASIKNPGAYTKAVGTRYHPADLYNDFMRADRRLFNDDGSPTGEREKLWDVMERKVEDSPDQDMTGEYLWPRTWSPTLEEWYGFDIHVLSEILGQYDSLGEREQFYAQYYNDPNDPDSQRLGRDDLQYYRKDQLVERPDGWYLGSKKLNVFCAMDTASTGWKESHGNAADFTAIAVIGMTADREIYVLELRQYKTNDYNEHYKNVVDLHLYWGFKSITIETNAAGKQVKLALENMCYEQGIYLKVEGVHRNQKSGSKAERHAAVLEPMYKQHRVHHYKGGLTPELEEQVMLARPRHDDIKDALCDAVEAARPAVKSISMSDIQQIGRNVVSHKRFGGRRRNR